jgi:hypothetical protein
MKREEYIRYLKQLIKKYHPDLCKDEYLEKTYNEITIILNNKLNRIKEKNKNGNVVFQNCNDINLSGNNSLIKNKNQDYEYYKMGIKYYRNIHPNQFYKRNEDRTYEPKTYEKRLKILNIIFLSFNTAEYYFKKVIMEYPKSEWADDSKEKLKLLKKLYKIYKNMNVEENDKIIDSNKFVEEMGIRIM